MGNRAGDRQRSGESAGGGKRFTWEGRSGQARRLPPDPRDLVKSTLSLRRAPSRNHDRTNLLRR